MIGYRKIWNDLSHQKKREILLTYNYAPSIIDRMVTEDYDSFTLITKDLIDQVLDEQLE